MSQAGEPLAVINKLATKAQFAKLAYAVTVTNDLTDMFMRWLLHCTVLAWCASLFVWSVTRINTTLRLFIFYCTETDCTSPCG